MHELCVAYPLRPRLNVVCEVQYHVQVVVAGVVVTEALFWAELVTVFGSLVTDFGPGYYDHLNYNHLSAVHRGLRPKR